jgi:predicted metal-dependent enzyme (double-stranded beta helix superfamily)
MFDLDQFVEDCKAAVRQDPTHKTVQELTARAVANPEQVLPVMGEPKRAEARTIYRSPTLTILALAWGPHQTIMPHNHDMWAVIGMYGGREDNIFWRRLPDCQDGRIEAAGARSLSARDCVPLGRDVIHSVLNPSMKLNAAFHIYGGDFFDAHRSEWDTDQLTEREMDIQAAVRSFEEANRRLGL